MSKLNNLQDSYLDNNNSNEQNQKNNETTNKQEKVLCNHCGRTANNGIRCLGVCVADNDY